MDHKLHRARRSGGQDRARARAFRTVIASSRLAPSAGWSVLPATAREFRRPTYISLNARNETPRLN
jgi:hypothetical protein